MRFVDRFVNGCVMLCAFLCKTLRPYQPPAGSASAKPPPSYNPMQVPGKAF